MSRTDTHTSTTSKTDSTSMNTNVETIGKAILLQTAIRYSAYCAITWLVLSNADTWFGMWMRRACY